MKQLRVQLGLTKFLHTLNPGRGKPQLLLGFGSVRCGRVVLKVYGRSRPNEAAVQGFWARTGVSVVEVIAAGDDPVSWLLMPMISGFPPELGDATTLTRSLSEIMTTAHAVYSPEVGCPRDLHTGIAGHLGIALAALRRHGYTPPDDWEGAARALYHSGAPSFLHGDLTLSNLLREPSGRLRLRLPDGRTGNGALMACSTRWRSSAIAYPSSSVGTIEPGDFPVPIPLRADRTARSACRRHPRPRDWAPSARWTAGMSHVSAV